MVTEDRRLSKAYDIIDSISSEPASSRDECSVYGEHVANKLRKLNDRSRAILINKINSSIFEAEMEVFDELHRPTPTRNGYYTHAQPSSVRPISVTPGHSQPGSSRKTSITPAKATPSVKIQSHLKRIGVYNPHESTKYSDVTNEDVGRVSTISTERHFDTEFGWNFRYGCGYSPGAGNL
ncbi:hypothetical protein JTB14_029362 [Gonioctena quinquepunctata]|nr:hypothetical protein JTB14_029362 [Gonioctena quinquepunctata]